jgi:hypothetical protein
MFWPAFAALRQLDEDLALANVSLDDDGAGVVLVQGD